MKLRTVLKRVYAIALSALMLLSLVACSAPQPPAPSEPDEAPAQVAPAPAPQQESEPAPEPEQSALSADVVVVGGGLAGLSAAIKASEGGASVILVEKLGMVGGSSMMSGGGLGATQSSVQKEFGIEDTNESWKALWEERQATSPANSQYPDWERVDWLIDYSAKSIDWYLSLGYKFRQPEGFGVDPVERLHFPYPEGMGGVLTSFLEGKAKELGATILTQTAATELIMESGAIAGIKAIGNDGEQQINAKAVILACGGFARNKELLERFTPEMAEFADFSVSSVGNTGDGIIMAEAVGAVPYEDAWVIGMGLTTPVREASGLYWMGTHVFINMEGNRFTNEAGHYAIVYNDAVYNSPGGSYMIFDSSDLFAYHTQSVGAASDTENIFKADTIEDLAAAIQVDPDTLASTVEEYNTAKTDAFGKPDATRVPISTAPYYAVKYYPCNMGTFGGVKTTDAFEVCDSSGNAIPGLYAAGEMSNRPFYNQVYMSGSALQVAGSSGQIAGAAAAEYVK